MPFTLAHPAAAIPLARPLRRFGVLPALVIGAMIPDFAYFRPFLSVGSRSHTLTGLFLFCLPVGIGVYVLFRFLLAPPLRVLLPEGLRTRIRLRTDTQWIAIPLGVLLGAITHVLWDSFTHEGSPMVETIPLLQRRLFTIDGYTLHVYRMLQHLSTLIGSSLIVSWLVRWYRSTPRQAEASTMPANLRLIVAGGILIGSAASGIRGGIGEIHGPGVVSGIRAFAGGAVIAGFSTFAVLVTAYSVLWHLAPARSMGRR